ncbi:MAG: recombinase family protein [Dehalococcoidia bacterium]|nr:recombinase family protein [Dehalococcoidia bacterium]
MMKTHRELVRAGMERARQQGKRIGRPRVTERSEFPQRYAAVAGRIGPGGLSRRQAAKELGIGYATLKRLLDAQARLADREETLAPPEPSQQSTSNGICEEGSATRSAKNPGDKFTETAA